MRRPGCQRAPALGPAAEGGGGGPGPSAVAALALAGLLGGCGATSHPTSAGPTRPATAATAAAGTSTSPSPSPPATASPSPASPTPPPLPAPPLAAADSSGSSALYAITGRRLAGLPEADLYTIASPLGSSLLGEHTGASGVDELAAISADGQIRELGTVDPTQFRDAIGSPDGREWAWMQGGPAGCGPGSTASGPTDVYIAATSGGSARRVARLRQLPGPTPWSFLRWTESGLVLREGPLPCGASDGPALNGAPTDLLDPTTGKLTSLSSVLGAGCALQDVSETGTMLCAPPATPTAAPAPSALLLRVVTADGSHQDLPIGPLASGCSGAQFGDMRVSGDGEHASLTRWCSSDDGIRITLWMVDAVTLTLTQVTTQANLQVAGWLPGSDVLVAAAFARWQGALAPSVTGTYTISATASVTRLMPALMVAASVTHP